MTEKKDKVWSWNNVGKTVDLDNLLGKQKSVIEISRKNTDGVDDSDKHKRSRVSSIISSDLSSESDSSDLDEADKEKILSDEEEDDSDIFDGISAMAMRGYYSDSEVNKVQRVDIKK